MKRFGASRPHFTETISIFARCAEDGGNDVDNFSYPIEAVVLNVNKQVADAVHCYFLQASTVSESFCGGNDNWIMIFALLNLKDIF